MEITLNVHNYRPEELKVLTQPDRSIIVEGNHEEKSPNGIVQNQFRRQYSLPEACNPLDVNSSLSRDGLLVVTCPKRVAKDAERKVPIGNDRF